MKRLSLLALILAGCAHMSQPLAPSSHYTMNLGANRAGGMTVTRNGNTSVVDLEFNDRGRGPKTHSVYTLDADGLPIDLTTSGNDYLKSPVSERFTMKDGVATWKNDAESGTSGTRGFFISMNGPAEELGMLARALLKAPGQTLPLLPAGQASIPARFRTAGR